MLITLRLALRNILRHKTRTAMTLAAIVVGVAGLILGGGWVADIFVALGESIIHSQSGHLQAARSGYFTAGSRSPEKYLIDDVASLAARCRALPGTTRVMARLAFSGLLSNGRNDLPIVAEGVESAAEAAMGSRLVLVAGRQLQDSDRYGVLLGEGLALALHLQPGERVSVLANALEGALNSVELEVVGVFQSMSRDYDSHALRLPLAAAQDLLGRPGANTLVIELTRTADTEVAAAALRGLLAAQGLEVKTWMELNDFYQQVVELYQRQFAFLQGIILMMVLLSVANSVNMNIFERVGEFGTMQALGNRRRAVFRLILAEGLVLGLCGSALGLAAGTLLALAISAVGIAMPPPPNANVGYIAHVLLLPRELLLACVIGCAAAVLASVLPAWRVSRLQVVDALRENL